MVMDNAPSNGAGPGPPVKYAKIFHNLKEGLLIAKKGIIDSGCMLVLCQIMLIGGNRAATDSSFVYVSPLLRLIEI